MNFLQQLQTHRGSLICLKTELFWYDGRGWDKNPGRICLLLDAGPATPATTTAAAAQTAITPAMTPTSAGAFLLIDGSSQWIWVAEQDIELLVNDQPIS